MTDTTEKMAANIAVALNGGEWKDGKWYSETHRKAWCDAVAPYASEINRLRAELLEAHVYAGQLACSLRRKHFSELPPFELQPDLYGRLTQIDNMTCGMARTALREKE